MYQTLPSSDEPSSFPFSDEPDSSFDPEALEIDNYLEMYRLASGISGPAKALFTSLIIDHAVRISRLIDLFCRLGMVTCPNLDEISTLVTSLNKLNKILPFIAGLSENELARKVLGLGQKVTLNGIWVLVSLANDIRFV